MKRKVIYPAIAASAIAVGAAGQQVKPRNVVVIITDQLAMDVFSCMGNPYISTPHLDRFVKEGYLFDRAYCANPVSVPSRYAILTGTMPSTIGMDNNHNQFNPVPEEILKGSIGNRMKELGYATYYAGKTHIPTIEGGKVNDPKVYGFDHRLAPKDPEGRDEAVQACVEMIRAHQDTPFFLYLSLINPHDICYLPIIEYQVANDRVTEVISDKHAHTRIVKGILGDQLGFPTPYENIARFNYPPVPDNFGEQPAPQKEKKVKAPNVSNREEESKAAQLAKAFKEKFGDHTGFAQFNYTEADWRKYRYLYFRLVEIIDAQVGTMMQALEESGLDKNTLVVFTSDHGEMNASHRRSTKGIYYEEAIRIPFIFRWKDVIPAGKSDHSHLVSNGLDLGPTLLDYAGATKSETMRGMSVKPIIEGKNPPWRDCLLVEGASMWCVMFDGHYKYVKQKARGEEFVFDQNKDPGEIYPMENKTLINRGREVMNEWYRRVGGKIIESNKGNL